MNENILVLATSPVVRLWSFIEPTVLESWHNETEHLLSSPKWLWLENSWLWNGVEVIDPHHQVHQVFVGDERVSGGHQHCSEERVLDDTHDWLV